MKTKLEIRARAKKMAVGYLKKHMAQDLEHLPHNCVYNYEIPVGGSYDKSRVFDVALSPRKSVSLVVIQPPRPIRVCTFSVKTKEWDGDVICDKEETSRNCRLFKSKISANESFNEFRNSLEDDSFTRLNYPDLAALQWVLGDRFHNKISFPFIFVWMFMVKLYIRMFKKNPEVTTSLPLEIWDAPNTKDT